MSVNVLYLIDRLAHGGTEKQLVQLITHLDRDQVRPHLCTLKPSSELFDDLDVPKQCLNFQSFARPSIVGVLRRLTAFMRRHDIHIVQTFFQDPTLLAALVKVVRPKTKLVCSFRDLGFWRTPAESRKMRLAYPFFSGFLANSEAVKDHFVRTDRLDPNKFTVIYNGIDLSKITPRDPGARNGKSPVVGIVANLNRPVKRVQDFIKAAAIVHAELPETSFMIIGDGHLRPEFEALCRELGIADAVTFTGRVANPLEYVRDFSVGVITSETEGLSNAIIEYMASGIPVVATAVGGNYELVENVQNGFLYPVGETRQLAESILSLLEDSQRSASMAATNIKKTNEAFSIPAMLEAHTGYYELLAVGGAITLRSAANHPFDALVTGNEQQK